MAFVMQYRAQHHGALSHEDTLNAPAIGSRGPFVVVVVLERPWKERVITCARGDGRYAVKQFV